MARKGVKREASRHSSQTEDQPLSSGDTVLIESDITMVDEGYETNHQSKKPGKSSSTSCWW